MIRSETTLSATGVLIVLYTSVPPGCGSANASELEFIGGITTVYQTTSDSRIDSEFTASADLGVSWHRRLGSWWMYLEGNTSPQSSGVTTFLPEANADAGTALDDDREGRIQLSELNFRFDLRRERALTLGLLDPSAYFDQSRITNDENTQFLGVAFVQNPSIEFPDYTLGAVYEHPFMNGPLLRLALTSSNGIADNPNVSYSQLVDVDDQDKGVFAAIGASWKAESWLLKTGAWTNTAPHETFDGDRDGAENYGAYLTAGYQRGRNALNLRLGLANPEVSAASRFSALAYQRSYSRTVLGIGAARTWLSPEVDDTDRDDTTQLETYLRYEVIRGLFATADVQYLINSAFDSSNESRDDRVAVYGIRLTYVYEPSAP